MLDLKVGDKVKETYEGYLAHCEHHDKPKGLTVDLKVSGVPAKVGLPTPKAFWRAKKGQVKEIRERWFFQEGNDALICWSNGEEEWRLADPKHLEKIK